MEKMVIDPQFWQGKRVFLTGHTGFKGAWLALWLQHYGAQVYGYSLPPPTPRNLYQQAGIAAGLAGETIADIRDHAALCAALQQAQPEIVLHLAAQAIVLESYRDPLETFSSNIMGTATLLQAIRSIDTVRAVVIVTSDKCYENREWVWGYRETDPMGGYDPYSASKGAAELITASMRQSFFPPQDYARHGVAIATARAGNVIGGGDWAHHRLLPDLIRSLLAGESCVIRHPQAVRPWQHVLEPLSGYVMLAQALWRDGPAYNGGWNFGPQDDSARPVAWIADRLVQLWPQAQPWTRASQPGPHENLYLKLDISQARARLGWSPVWSLDTTLERLVDWYSAYAQGQDLAAISRAQLVQFCQDQAQQRTGDTA